MAFDEWELKVAELESGKLRKVISDVEAALAASTPGTRGILESLLRNTKGRLLELERRTEKAAEEKSNHEREEAAVVALTRQETALSAKEQETYGVFLKEDFFTKNDFGRLGDFYAQTWDRLSDRGKDEMSHRVWEGVRHGEYTFGELPAVVREKEAKRAYELLAKRSADAPDVARIPETDRRDFLRVYEAGKREEAEKVLGRDSFKLNMFRSPEAASRRHAEVNLCRESESSTVEVKVAANQVPDKAERASDGTKNGTKDLSGFALDGVKLVETESQGPSSDIPNAGGATPTRGRSTPGG